MTWRLAESLQTLRTQINGLYPDRPKASDGTIGDENHVNRTSDHNPWVDDGVVTAIDFTHDPQTLDCNKLAEVLVQSKDPRIKYIIWNRAICSSQIQPWVWRPYTGYNPHDNHIHISVQPIKSLYDSVTPWITYVVYNPIRELQTLLNKHGAGLKVDGIRGPLTNAAIINFLKDYDKLNQLIKESEDNNDEFSPYHS